MNFQRVGVAVVGLLLLLPGLATSGCRLTPLAAAEPESIRGREEVRSVQEKSLTVSVHRTQQTAPMRALEPVEYAVELRGGRSPLYQPL